MQRNLSILPLFLAAIVLGCSVEKGNAKPAAAIEQARSQIPAVAKEAEDWDAIQYTRDLVMKKAREVFPVEDSSKIMSILNQYGVEPDEQERERVQIATLKLSEGKIEKLRMQVKIAKEDYRDVLAYAEYPLEMACAAWKMDADKAKEIREKDRKQYLEWLTSTVARTPTTVPQTRSSSTDSPKKLVFIGTITKIYPFSAPATAQRRWAVRAHVDRVVSGTLSGATFTFTVHSPAQSGLTVGRAYTIKAVWTAEGYVVDESTLRRVRRVAGVRTVTAGGISFLFWRT